MNDLQILKEIGELQESYQNLLSSKRFTKKDLCDLVIPFRDKCHLTDLEALQITRNEISIKEISILLEGKR